MSEAPQDLPSIAEADFDARMRLATQLGRACTHITMLRLALARAQWRTEAERQDAADRIAAAITFQESLK